MSDKIDRYIRNMPQVYQAGTNIVLNAILQAFAGADDDVVTNLDETKAQLFVATATGQYLDRLASGLAVSRPSELGMVDSSFQQLIPNLSLKAKQVRKIFYDTMDVFWGPLYSRANTTSINVAPFSVFIGDSLLITIDSGTEQTIKVLPGDVVTSGAATALEVATLLGRIQGSTISIITDELTGNQSINIRTNTPGSRGSVDIEGGTLSGSGKLNFTIKNNKVTDLTQRTVIYEIHNKELIIELPAEVPTLRRSLEGSHHFHTNANLASPIAPANGIWAGSFFYNPNATNFTVTSQNARIQTPLVAGQVYTKITVDDSSKIPNSDGFLIFDFGLNTQEVPVPYISVPNSNTILLNATHTFQQNHGVNSYVNFILPRQVSYTPATDGHDLAIYLTSPVDARNIVEALLQNLVAAGVVINFVVLLPDFPYITFNPYA